MKLTATEAATLRAIADRQVVVVWQSEFDFPRRGWKPWYALSAGVRGHQLHSLWMAMLIRVDRGAGALELAGENDLHVARARLTPRGRQVLAAMESKG